MIAFIEIFQESKNWNDIYNKLISNFQTSGKLFEEFCKCYYLCEPTVKDDYKNVWLFSEIPIRIKEKLNLGKIDHGIDLLLENREGQFAVVQCKFRQDQNSIISWTKDKLANLFADGDKADYFIIFTNASGIDGHTHSKKRNQLKLISLGDFLSFSSDSIDNMRDYILGKNIVIKAKEPRDYQLNAIDDVIKGFENDDRGQLILPCGAGKTLVSLWIKEKLAPKHTIMLFPSLALLRQTKNEWANNQKQYIPYICVCSEKDIDKKTDSTLVHTYEIGGRVSTNPTVIRGFLQKNDQTIIYSTYQSLTAIKEATLDSDFTFDLAICDEAHKTSGNKLGSFGLIHDDNNIKVKKRLYMTATPRIVSDKLKKQNPELIDYIADMSDEKNFGSEFHRMSFKEAIDRGILVDYQIIAIGISDAELEVAIREREFVSEDESIDEIANNYALNKFMNEHRCTHAITFHSSVAKAEDFKKRHLDLFPGSDVFHVNGKQTTNDRNKLMSEFRNSPKSIITNAKCLTEGIDVPAIDTVYFCDPKNSMIDIVQAAGRALRKDQNKEDKIGYIVVPLYHREKAQIDAIVEESPFKNLISVIRAMSDHDERLIDEIKSIKLGRGERATKAEHISIETPLELIRFEGFESQLQKAIFMQVIDKIMVPWRRFEEARKFVRGLHLKDNDEWREYNTNNKDKIIDIPATPEKVYKKSGWKSWGDWLGTGTIASYKIKFKSFEEARVFAHTLKLKSKTEWVKYSKGGKRPTNIHSNPQQKYKNMGWNGWPDWLGRDFIYHKNKLLYEEARAFVHKANLKSADEWFIFWESAKMPANIPKYPSDFYKNEGWKSWGDWLGTGTIASYKIEFKSFEEARDLTHKLGLKGKNQWLDNNKKGKRLVGIPSRPDQTYKNKGWVSWPDWLGMV